MTEKSRGWIPRELGPGNYGSPGNVKIRWWNYIEYVQPHFDMQTEIINNLRFMGKLTGNEDLLDVGCSDGSFLVDLRYLYQHHDGLTGLEPHLEQLEGDLDTDLSFVEELNNMEDIDIVKGVVQSMPFADNTFDGVFARRMMYEVPEYEQRQAMLEIKRVSKEKGFFVLTTSGYFNKPEHRKFEDRIAHFLGITSPPLMNASYTAQRAAIELPKWFNHIEPIWQDGTMVFKSTEEAEDYYLSIVTMQDQFNPIPNIGALRQAIDMVVRKEVEESIALTGDFRDPIELAGFICWD
ncbi:hypothetical protein BVY01_01290 [bacterium I07]|nr:hypothetical protein BVY01_01290 [bacterium I07]